jgi:1-phosphofructokinase family hexose kinase
MPEVIIVNLNPALDRTAIVRKYNPFGVNKAERLVVLAGGKGANVGRALKTLGYNNFVCSGIIGGDIGRIFQKKIEEEQINNDYFWIRGETRIAYATYEEATGIGIITNEIGPEITDEEIRTFSNFLIEKYLPLVKMFALSGGAPPSFPPEEISKLVSIFKKMGKEVFIDTSGKILELCSQIGAFCIKINEDELKGAFNVDINDRRSLINLYIELHQTGTRWLIITRGEKGAIFIDEEAIVEGTNKKLYSKYSIGSGDAFYSAVIYGKLKELPSEEILKLAMACGTANTLSFGGCIFKMEDVERIKEEIDIKRLLI